MKTKSKIKKPIIKKPIKSKKKPGPEIAFARAIAISNGHNKTKTMVLVNSRVTPKDKTNAEKICEREGTKLSIYIRECVNYLVENHA